MKYLTGLMILLFSFGSKLIAHDLSEEAQIPKDVLDVCEEGVLCALDGKAYLHPDKVAYFNGSFFLLSDDQQWMPLPGILRNNSGLYLYATLPECPNYHPWFKKVKGVYYCLNQECDYFYVRSFLKCPN